MSFLHYFLFSLSLKRMQPDAGYTLSRVEQHGLMDGEGLEELSAQLRDDLGAKTEAENADTDWSSKHSQGGRKYNLHDFWLY